MTTDSPADRRFHELVRYAYAEHLLAQQRVLVLGGLARATCERIAELRARFVVGVTDDEELAQDLADDETPSNVTYQAMSFGALNFRDGSFDVVVVPDLSLLEDPEASLREARRVLTPDGVALITLANRDAMGGLAGVEPPEMGYTELFEVCSNVWSIVRMAGQSPFVGYVVADFAPDDDEPSISFDASLAPDEGEEVEFYVAICSDEPVEIDPYAILQMPLAAVVPQDVDARDDGALDELRQDVLREKERAVEHNLRAQRLEHELKAMADEAAKARDRAARFARELEEEKKGRQRAEIEGQMARRSPELGELREKVATLTADLEAARAAASERDRERSHVAEQAAWGKEHERLAGELSNLRAELDAAERARLQAEARATKLETETGARADEARRDQQGHAARLAERDARIAGLEAALEAAPRPAQLEALAGKVRTLEEQVALLRAAVDEGDGDRGRDVGRVEEELRHRVRRISELELEVARREAIVRDLCAQLEEVSQAAPEPPLADVESRTEGRSAEDLARSAERDSRLATLEDERQASQWRVEELEARLAVAGKGLVEVDVAAAMTRGYRMRIAELQQELFHTEAELAVCRTRGDELTRRLGECEAQSRELSGTVGRLETYARELEAESATARTAVADAAGKSPTSETHTSFVSHMAEIAQEELLELRSILTIREAQLAALEGARRGFAVRARELELEDGERRTIEADLSGRAGELRQRLEQTQAELFEVRAAHASLENDFRAARGLAETRTKEVDKLRREVTEARQHEDPALDSVRAELTRARDELGKKREELTGNDVMMRSLMAQLEERDGRIALLERHALEEGQRSDGALRGYDERLQQMSDELVTLRSEHFAAHQELDAVRRELSRLAEDPRGAPLQGELGMLLRKLRS